MGVTASVGNGNHCIIQNNCTLYSCIIDNDVLSESAIDEG
jgi:hypothetical protein